MEGGEEKLSTFKFRWATSGSLSLTPEHHLEPLRYYFDCIYPFEEISIDYCWWSTYSQFLVNLKYLIKLYAEYSLEDSNDEISKKNE